MNTHGHFRLKNLTHTKYIFNHNEHEKLLKYGAWATVLDEGKEMPASERQNHFVAVCSGEMEPQTDFEFLWLRYKDAVQTDQKLSTLIESATRNEHQIQAIRREAINDSVNSKTEIESLNTTIKQLRNEISVYIYERKIKFTEPIEPRDLMDKYSTRGEDWREQP